MTSEYAIVFGKLREVLETETGRVQILAPNADDKEVEEMREIDEIRRMADALEEQDPSTFAST